MNFLLLAALGLLLVSAGIQDARTREIANWKNILIAVLAPLWWYSCGLSVWPDMAVQAGIAAIIFTIFCAMFFFGWMGGGDVKMIGALALWFPPELLTWMLVVMSVGGGALTIIMMADRAFRKSDAEIEVPYGVAIAIAALLALREPVVNQYWMIA